MPQSLHSAKRRDGVEEAKTKQSSIGKSSSIWNDSFEHKQEECRVSWAGDSGNFDVTKILMNSTSIQLMAEYENILSWSYHGITLS